MRLRAADGDVAIDVLLDADGENAKPIVLQGADGLSQKGPAAGNASYYYSLTRLPTSGSVRVGETTHRVAGLSWMDREWSTSVLDEGQTGWDWFALQLDDGRDLMFFQIRRDDGTVDPVSGGVLVEADGLTRRLSRDEVGLEVLGRWRSPRDGTSYPARWRLRVPAGQIDVEVVPLLADQELDVSFRYWEGAVQVRGASGGRPAAGSGYVELTGYGDAARPR
jgi:predicted secreted hydrolase